MSDKKIGLELREVPRNGETEFIFKVAERDGDPTFLTLDEIAEQTLIDFLYEHQCNTSADDPHEARFYMNCQNQKDAYVRRVGFDAALEATFGSSACYLGRPMLANFSIIFAAKALDVINKYRSYKSRYFDERLR